MKKIVVSMLEGLRTGSLAYLLVLAFRIQESQATTANIFIDNSIFEIFINKGEKVFSGRVYPHADQNGILIKSGTPTGTYYELDYGRKAN